MKTPEVVLTRAEFDRLGEYSCSIPTGTTVGKRWKRNRNAYMPPTVIGLHFFDGTPIKVWPQDDWWMGEYIEIADPGKVGIVWRKIAIQGAP